MPRAMSNDVENVIVQALSRGLSRSQISGVVGVSARSVTRISSNMSKYGTPRPPPKGLKLGRPARVTRAQAEAMLAWMAACDQNFFVKDLAKYLQENYSYKGSDATVRRCLIRAGYKRKLPWHRSEKTTWLPPDHPPVFEIVREADDHRGEDQEAEEDVMSEEEAEEHQHHEQQHLQQQHDADIDPALQDAASSALLDIETHNAAMPPTTTPLHHQTDLGAQLPHPLPFPFESAFLPSQIDATTTTPHTTPPFNTQPPILSPPPPPSTQHQVQPPTGPPTHPQTQPTTQNPHPLPLPRPRGRPPNRLSNSKPRPTKTKPKSKPTTAATTTSATPATTATTTTTPQANPLSTQLQTLQSEVLRQQELIQQLQRQLLAQQQQSHPHPQQHPRQHQNLRPRQHPEGVPSASAQFTPEEEFRHQLLAAAEVTAPTPQSRRGGGGGAEVDVDADVAMDGAAIEEPQRHGQVEPVNGSEDAVQMGVNHDNDHDHTHDQGYNSPYAIGSATAAAA